MPLGFKCGIEIHQQLDTHKLFCSCTSVLREDDPQIIVRRRMRAVAGETGEIDRAAIQEVLKNREIVYQAYNDTNCLVELDEEPPHNINEEALTTALKFCLLVKANIADNIQVMRKTVIDGSNTSGFQRTALIGYDGKISTSLGNMAITSVCIEEDAARKISENENELIYRVDRLGVPLIEITTDASILNPQHAKETAEKIGTILRTLEVKRGIGTIRQDVNVSIEGGARVEIKGCQELNLIPKILDYEIKRQEVLIAVREELNARGIKSEQLEENFIDLCENFKNTQCQIVREAIGKGEVCYGVKLKNFSGLLGNKFCGISKSKEPRLGKEISQYVKTGTKLKGLFHSDELPNYGIIKDEISGIRKILNCDKNDAFILISGDKEDVLRGLKIAVERAKMALYEVPEETRKATEEETYYMRPLPGASRMYPETDVCLIETDEKFIEKVRENLPESIDSKSERYASIVGKELANQLIHSKISNIFDKFAEKYKVKPSLIAGILLSTPKEIKKGYQTIFDMEENSGLCEEVIRHIEKGQISHSSVSEIFYYAKKEGKEINDVIKERNLGLATRTEILNIATEIMAKDKSIVTNRGKFKGMIMGKFKGRANIEDVEGVVNRLL